MNEYAELSRAARALEPGSGRFRTGFGSVGSMVAGTAPARNFGLADMLVRRGRANSRLTCYQARPAAREARHAIADGLPGKPAHGH